MELTQEEKAALVLEASKGVKGATAREREFETMKRVVQLTSLTRDVSLPMQLLSAEPFVARVVSVVLEESSTRYVIKMANKDGEEEMIRTMRTDNELGEKIADMLNKAVGKRCVIYKVYDEIKGTNSKKVRVALYVEPLGD